MGRIELELGPSAPRELVTERLARTFGIANFSYAGRTALDLDAVIAAILENLGDRSCGGFRVLTHGRSKMAGYTFSSCIQTITPALLTFLLMCTGGSCNCRVKTYIIYSSMTPYG
jgi:hypothetical protein